MRDIDDWLSRYGESHRNPVNERVHWVCVPLIMLSIFGLLWSIPVPEAWRGVSAYMNWASAFAALCLIYYLFLSWRLTLGMLAVSGVLLVLTHWLGELPGSRLAWSVGIFVAAWVAQFIGHEIEGRKPTFLEDVQFLLIGPLWLLSFVYRRLNIRCR